MEINYLLRELLVRKLKDRQMQTEKSTINATTTCLCPHMNKESDLKESMMYTKVSLLLMKGLPTFLKQRATMRALRCLGATSSKY